MADTIVTAEKLNEIKTKINNELKNRRTYTNHGINVTQYQGSAWDFSATSGREVTNDQLHKLIDPMLQINDFMQDNTLIGDKPTTIPDLTTVEKFVDNLTTKGQTSSDSGCRGSCAGLCYGACYSGCTGCSSCSGNCYTSCGDGCAGCSGSCSGCSGCSTSCSGCSSGCT